MYSYLPIALVFISLLTLILSLGLAFVALSDYTLGQRLILALAYLAFVGIFSFLACFH